MQQKYAHFNNQLSTKTNATTPPLPPKKPQKEGKGKGKKEIERVDMHLT